jgi:endonuclease G
MIKKISAFLAVVALVLTSCEGYDPFGGSTDGTEVYEIVVEPSLLQFGAEGGEQAVRVEANVEYELLCEAGWVAYSLSDAGIVVVVEGNTAKDRRETMLVVYSKEYEIYKPLIIEQDGYVAPEEPEVPEVPEEPEQPEDPETPEGPTTTDNNYNRTWAEQPEWVANQYYIHKTYYSTLMDGKRVRNFSVCYDTVKMCSRWVAYPGHSVYRKYGSYQVGENNNKGRTNAWAFDDAVTKYASSSDYNCAYEFVSKYDAKTDAYDTAKEPVIPHRRQADICFNNGFGWGWARGHMLPSSQRYNTWENNAQTCYATNIMVQQYDFNGGSWADVESLERNKNCSDTLYVVVGTLFENNETVTRFGRTIGVPTHCFKLLLRTKSGSSGKAISDITSADELMCIGFLFENSEKSASVKISTAATSVAEIEKRSGFKFFRNLNPAIADKVKSQNNPSDWGVK